MLDLEVIDEPATATAALDPLRSRILAVLAEPGSATTVATAIGESRQKVNYHLRALERQGLVGLVREVPRRGLTERIVVASARSYMLAPDLLGEIDTDDTDRLSARYLIALAARLVREVATLARRADTAGKSLATLAIDTDLRFASAARRTEFADELATSIARLASEYHDETTPGGRWHRLVVAAHPRPARNQRKANHVR